jgi:hypothetical protein
VNLEEDEKSSPRGRDAILGIVEKAFLTESGKRLAKEILLEKNES